MSEAVPPQPIVFLDFDDVICTGKPYSGHDLFSGDWPPHDLFERLFHPPAVQTLLAVMTEHQPQVVITTSWLRLMERPGFEQLFRRTGLAPVAEALHQRWCVHQDAGAPRLWAIEEWLKRYRRGEPFVVLDDLESGWSLRESKLDQQGRVVLCDVGVGLHAGHLPAVRKALTT